MRILISIVMLGVMLVPTLATAQEDECPALVQTAYETTQSVCEAAGRDEACYGNNLITAEAQPDIELKFETPGDVADVSDIAALQLSTMDVEAQAWGISLMRLQAGLPDNAPEYVEVVLFGNVEIDAADTEDAYAPMQAFYLRTGMEDRPCEAAPDSGILIQTPDGVGKISLLINEVVIDLGSTAYVQAGTDEMIISVIEGEGVVSAFDVSVTLPAGTRARVPLDADGVAVAAPIGPEPYAGLETLPIVLLSEEIAITPPLGAAPSSNIEGNWHGIAVPEYEVACSGSSVKFSASESDIALALDGDTLRVSVPAFNAELAFTPDESGGYVQTNTDNNGITYTRTLNLQADDTLTMQILYQFPATSTSTCQNFEHTLVQTFERGE